MAMLFNKSKPTLHSSIDKLIWHLRLTIQLSIGCTPFLKHLNRSLATFGDAYLDKGMSLMSKEESQRLRGKRQNRR